MPKIAILHVAAHLPPSSTPDAAELPRTKFGHADVVLGRVGGAAIIRAPRETPSMADLLEQRFEEAARCVVAELLRVGARPSLPLDEVPDPRPMETPPSTRAAAMSEADEQLTSRRITCVRCGAPAAVRQLTSGLACPYCAAIQPLDPDTKASLERYEAHTRALLAAGAIELDPGRLWALSPGSVSSSCCHCGASNANAGGRLDENCRFCRSPLVPSAGAMLAGLTKLETSAGLRVKEVRGRRHRFVASRTRAGRQLEWLLMGGATSALLLFSAMMVAVGLRASGGIHAALGPLLYGASFIALVFFAAAFVLGQRWWTRRGWARGYERVAQQLSSLRVGGMPELAHWVDTWWRDTLPLERFGQGPAQGVVVTQIAGLPVAVEAEPLLASGTRGDRLSRAFVAVAAALPLDAPYRLTTEPAASILSSLESCGFAVELHLGGVLVRATSETIQRMATARELAVLGPIAFASARLARVLGATAPGA